MMDKTCLQRAIRFHSRPVLFLVSVCMTFALLFFRIDPVGGWAFIIASSAAMAVFGLVASRSGCGADIERQARQGR